MGNFLIETGVANDQFEYSVKVQPITIHFSKTMLSQCLQSLRILTDPSSKITKVENLICFWKISDGSSEIFSKATIDSSGLVRV